MEATGNNKFTSMMKIQRHPAKPAMPFIFVIPNARRPYLLIHD
jgi:hypothetical protein